MSGVGLTQQLQQDLQNELTMTNQLLRLISVELQKIKILTSLDGEFEANVKQNTLLTEKLANILKVDINKLPVINRAQMEEENKCGDG